MGGRDNEADQSAGTDEPVRAEDARFEPALPKTPVQPDPDAELHIDGEDDEDEDPLHIDENPLELFDTHGVRHSG
jgi:hypothetical protein